jgi:hypothetical protein
MGWMTDVEGRSREGTGPVAVTPMASSSSDTVSRRRRVRRLVVASGVAAALLVVAFAVVDRPDDGGTDVAVKTTGDAFVKTGAPAPDATTSSTERSSPATTTITMTLTGEPVRGSAVTMTFHGLEASKGRDVYLTIETDGPVHTTSGGDRVGSLGYGSAVVDDDGVAAFSVFVPNALSGQDDIIPVVPGDRYLLILSSRLQTEGIAGTVPFTVVEADRGRAYAAGAGRGAVECGAPPLEANFDGKLWIPAEPDPFPPSVQHLPGTFTVEADGTGRFVAADGTVVSFAPARVGYSC